MWPFKPRKRRREEVIAHIIADCESTHNSGLLEHLLMDVPFVTIINQDFSATGCFVEVRMNDGYRLTTRAFHSSDALKKAIHKALDRVRERWHLT